MIGMFGWVAFGSGPRHFTTTLDIPLLGTPFRERSGELSGRIVFGIATVLMAAMFAVCTGVGIHRLRRARH